MQNRNKLVDLFIGNITNYIVHKILEMAIDNLEIINKYKKESGVSFDIAKIYRDKINPSTKLPDSIDVKKRIIQRVKIKLNERIKEGYKRINLDLVETITSETLEKLRV